jgi:hypothetical protein
MIDLRDGAGADAYELLGRLLQVNSDGKSLRYSHPVE